MREGGGKRGGREGDVVCRRSDAALIIFPRRRRRRPSVDGLQSVWLCGGGKGKRERERQNAISVISGWARCERGGRHRTNTGSPIKLDFSSLFRCEVSICDSHFHEYCVLEVQKRYLQLPHLFSALQKMCREVAITCLSYHVSMAQFYIFFSYAMRVSLVFLACSLYLLLDRSHSLQSCLCRKHCRSHEEMEKAIASTPPRGALWPLS